jgi:putative aminopeptidase FrvX
VALLALAARTAVPARAGAQDTARLAEARNVLAQLVETYGVSGHEAPVRDAVIRLLPAWTSPTIDSIGNVLVRAGAGDPLVVFVAHLDEIGFTVTAIGGDGRLDLRPVGGFYPSLFEAEPALVHTATGIVPAVIAPRDSVGPAPRRSPGGLHADPGTASRAATEALGIRTGDAVTMPKAFVALAGTRATARSFDDRVGCAAQLLALRRLDPRRLRHAVLFIFSVREEVGLDGARFAASRLAAEHPARVHAVDTFVSSDAPLETRTFADAPLGGGAVVRAVDNSSVTPPALVDSLLALARARRIPLAAGATNGGNDGSVFTRFGVPDVGLGWPLRYAHSPAEVIDLMDVVALADILQASAEKW